MNPGIKQSKTEDIFIFLFLMLSIAAVQAADPGAVPGTPYFSSNAGDRL